MFGEKTVKCFCRFYLFYAFPESLQQSTEIYIFIPVLNNGIYFSNQRNKLNIEPCNNLYIFFFDSEKTRANNITEYFLVTILEM